MAPSVAPPVPLGPPFYEAFAPTWVYPTSRRRGAFRLVRAGPLQNKTNPRIEVLEYRDIGYLKPGYKGRLGTLQYVAISHVWKESGDIVQTRELSIGTLDKHGNDDTHDISWLGLRRMANAVVELGYSYFWLDFLCVDQRDVKNDHDKKFQICMMGDVYRYASSVLVMVGGASDVVTMDASTGWMDRAWTLQETVIPIVAQAKIPVAWRNPHPIWVYLKWETGWGTGSLKNKDKMSVTAEPDTLLVDMNALMDLADAPAISPLPQVTVLDGQFSSTPKDVSSIPVARRALRAALHPNRYARSAGVWRCMFLRTSSQPVDIVYSLMGIFEIAIDPFRTERNYVYLFQDLARKTAAIATQGPAWLTISGVDGSLIPRSATSRILPKYPHVPNDGKPTYKDNAGNSQWVGQWVDKTDDYISTFDIQFFTHSQPHIINAYMIVVKHALINNRKQRRVRLRLGRTGKYQGSCICRKDGGGFFASSTEIQGCQAVYVGKIGDLKIHKKSLYANQYYFLFMKWSSSSGGWKVIGDGVFRPNTGGPKFKATSAVMGKRQIFTVGHGSQTWKDKWPEKGGGPLDLRRSHFRYHSYGVVPLKDAHGGLSMTSKSIAWLGHKGSKPRNRFHHHNNWKAFNIGYRSSDVHKNKVNKKLTGANKLLLVSSHAVDSPRTATSRTRDKLAQMGTLSVNYNYSDWKHSECTKLLRAGIEGIMLRKTKKKRPSARYYVNIMWGEYMIYLQTIPDRRTRKEYEQTVVIPYRDFHQVINTKYLIPPTPPQQPVYNYPWSSEYPGLDPIQYQAMQNWIAYQNNMRQVQLQQDALQADAAAKSALLQQQMAAQRMQWQAQGWPWGQNRCGCFW